MGEDERFYRRPRLRDPWHSVRESDGRLAAGRKPEPATRFTIAIAAGISVAAPFGIAASASIAVADAGWDLTMRSHQRRQRGMTLPEMMVALVVLTIVIFAIGSMFEQTVKHYALSSSELSSEQQARIAVTKVTDAMRQASLVVGATPDANGNTPIPIPIPSPTGIPSNQVVFYRVSGLDPNMPTDKDGQPVPCYDKVTISWTAPNPAPSPPQWGAPITEDVQPYSTPCPGETPTAFVLANDVTSFTVTRNGGSFTNAQTADYQVDVQVTKQARVDQAPTVYQLTATVHPVMAGGG